MRAAHRGRSAALLHICGIFAEFEDKREGVTGDTLAGLQPEAPPEASLLFRHGTAQGELGASILWVNIETSFADTEDLIIGWQTRRDLQRRVTYTTHLLSPPGSAYGPSFITVIESAHLGHGNYPPTIKTHERICKRLPHFLRPLNAKLMSPPYP